MPKPANQITAENQKLIEKAAAAAFAERGIPPDRARQMWDTHVARTSKLAALADPGRQALRDAAADKLAASLGITRRRPAAVTA